MRARAGVAAIQEEAELRQAIAALHEAVADAGGFSWHQDALAIVEAAALAHLAASTEPETDR